jgi:hypothetical protein
VFFNGRKEFDEALRLLQPTSYTGDESSRLIDRGLVLAAIPGHKEEAEKVTILVWEACGN